MLRRYAAELIGTFVIVFAPVTLITCGQTTLLEAALVSGLAVLAMVYALGPISAAHFNPAVTLGFAVARRFPWRFVGPYWLCQVLGGCLAAIVVRLIFGTVGGAHEPSGQLNALSCLALEALITFILMITIMSVATDKRVSSSVPGLAIGLAVVMGVLVAGRTTGGSMNPARSFGPALFSGGAALPNYWIYAVGPCLGAVAAALIFEVIRLEPQHAKGAPNELLEALEQIEGTP